MAIAWLVAGAALAQPPKGPAPDLSVIEEEVRAEIAAIEKEIEELEARLAQLRARLPESGAGEPIAPLVELQLAADGAVVLDGKVLVGEELTRKLKELAEVRGIRRVMIAADAHTPYKEIRILTEKCRAAGIWDISFASRERPAPDDESTPDSEPE